MFANIWKNTLPPGLVNHGLLQIFYKGYHVIVSKARLTDLYPFKDEYPTETNVMTPEDVNTFATPLPAEELLRKLKDAPAVRICKMNENATDNEIALPLAFFKDDLLKIFEFIDSKIVDDAAVVDGLVADLSAVNNQEVHVKSGMDGDILPVPTLVDNEDKKPFVKVDLLDQELSSIFARVDSMLISDAPLVNSPLVNIREVYIYKREERHFLHAKVACPPELADDGDLKIFYNGYRATVSQKGLRDMHPFKDGYPLGAHMNTCEDDHEFPIPLLDEEFLKTVKDVPKVTIRKMNVNATDNEIALPLAVFKDDLLKILSRIDHKVIDDAAAVDSLEIDTPVVNTHEVQVNAWEAGNALSPDLYDDKHLEISYKGYQVYSSYDRLIDLHPRNEANTCKDEDAFPRRVLDKHLIEILLDTPVRSIPRSRVNTWDSDEALPIDLFDEELLSIFASIDREDTTIDLHPLDGEFLPETSNDLF